MDLSFLPEQTSENVERFIESLSKRRQVKNIIDLNYGPDWDETWDEYRFCDIDSFMED